MIKFMKKKLKDLLLTILKVSFACFIIFYMIKSGKLDLSQVAEIFTKPLMCLKVILTLLGIYALITVRWFLLLKWQGIPTTFKSVLRINAIGLFFNSFMPGSVGGDLVKAYYISKENRDYRTRAIITIIIDRILGFETLMLVAFIALLLNYNFVSTIPELRGLSLSIGLYIIFSLVAAAAVFSRRVKHFFVKIGFPKIVTLIPKNKILITIYDAFHIYSNQKMRLLKAMAITIPLDILNIYIFFTIGREMGGSSMSLTSYFTAIPVGLLMLSLPIAPAGIGVGQGAFFTLFKWFGAISGKLGATVITIYQLLTICLNMCFVFVYLRNQKEVKQAMNMAKEHNT